MGSEGSGRIPDMSRWKAFGAALVGSGAAILGIGGDGRGRHVSEAAEERATESSDDSSAPFVEKKRQDIPSRADAALMEERVVTEAPETDRPESPYDAVDFTKLNLSVEAITDLTLTDPDAWWKMDKAERSASAMRDENRTARRHLYEALTDEQKETFEEALANMRIVQENDRVDVVVDGDFAMSVTISPDVMDGGPAALRIATSVDGELAESWQYNETVTDETVREAMAVGVYMAVMDAVRNQSDEEGDMGEEDTGM